MNLEQDKISKLMLHFSIPAIIGMVVNALYNTVDRIFVSKGVGDVAFSGLTLTGPLSLIILAFTMLIGLGSTSMLSIRLGEKNMEEAEKILTNCFVMLIIVAISITLIGTIFLRPILFLFKAEPETLQYSEEYMRIIFGGCFFQVIGFGMNHMMRASGKPRLSMATNLIGAILNMILDPIFIYIFHMGIVGAAIATVISQAVSMVWVLSYYFGKNPVVRLRRKHIKLYKDVVISILSIGISPFANQIAASLVQVVAYSRLLTYSGDMAVAAMGAVASLSQLILMSVIGINQGSQPIVGYNYGAKHYKRVKKTLKYALTAATLICTAGWLFVEIFPRQLISLFANGEELFTLAIPALRIYLFALPLNGAQLVSAMFYQSINKAKISLFLNLLRQVILLIPLFVILPLFFGLNGVWLSAPVADTTAFTISMIMLMYNVKKIPSQDNITV